MFFSVGKAELQPHVSGRVSRRRLLTHRDCSFSLIKSRRRFLTRSISAAGVAMPFGGLGSSGGAMQDMCIFTSSVKPKVTLGQPMALIEVAQRAAVVAEARSWIGTPYHNCADIKGTGVDCGMLIVRVFVATGLCAHLIRGPNRPIGNWTLSEERISA